MEDHAILTKMSFLTLGYLIFSNQKAWIVVVQKNGKQDLGIYVTASTSQRSEKGWTEKKNLSTSKDGRQVCFGLVSDEEGISELEDSTKEMTQNEAQRDIYV